MRFHDVRRRAYGQEASRPAALPCRGGRRASSHAAPSREWQPFAHVRESPWDIAVSRIPFRSPVLQDVVERLVTSEHTAPAVFGHRFTAPRTRSLGKINGMRREPGVDARCIPFAKRYPTTMPREELGSLPNQTDTCLVGGQDHSGSLSKQFAEPSRVLWRHYGHRVSSTADSPYVGG
jgi:hypothetical protein